MKIRAATPSDVNRIQQIQIEVLSAGAGSFYSPDQLEQWATRLSAETYLPAIHADQLFVTTDDSGRLTGFAHVDAQSGEIGMLCVAVEHQGEGLGRELIRECLSRARKADTKKVCVGAPLDSVEFFERLEFEIKQPGSILLDDGSAIAHTIMGRPVELPQLQDWVRALEESVAFFGSDSENKRAQERYVAESFLRGIGKSFVTQDIQYGEDPPDVLFEDANFEVKTLHSKGRKMHREYKDNLAKARVAFWQSEMLTGFTPTDVALDTVIRDVQGVGKKYVGHYAPAVQAKLDLLVYANLIEVFGITPTTFPDLGELKRQGWRSVSFVYGTSTSCVIWAADDAPQFLRDAAGHLQHGGRPICG